MKPARITSDRSGGVSILLAVLGGVIGTAVIHVRALMDAL